MFRNVYVTLAVDFQSSGDWCKDYFLGLDSDPRLAVQYPVMHGAYLYDHKWTIGGFERVYKNPYTNRGYVVIKDRLYFDNK